MNIDYVKEEEWKENCNPAYLCTFDFYWQDLRDAHPVIEFTHHEDGLGPYISAVLKIKNSCYWLSSYHDPENPIGRIKDDENPKDIDSEADRVSVSVRSYEPNHQVALTNLCSAFKIQSNELAHIREELTIAKWALLRLDDNGNEIEMFRYHDKFCAEYVRDIYTAKGHKQAYFVKYIQDET